MAAEDRIRKFRENYSLRNMNRNPANDDELRQMVATDGMLDLEACSLPHIEEIAVVVELPCLREQAPIGRFLWVVRSDDLPIALEACKWGRQLKSNMIKHSNLTGGAPAHSGGELWLIKDQGVLVNANSGRYGADTPAELAEFVEALRGLGLPVASMGFDLDNPLVPNVVQVGPIEWLAPYG